MNIFLTIYLVGMLINVGMLYWLYSHNPEDFIKGDKFIAVCVSIISCLVWPIFWIASIVTAWRNS